MEKQKSEIHGMRLIKILLLNIVIALHLLLFIILISSLCILPFYADWYISVPLMTWILRLPFVDGMCPLTELESRLRVSLGMPPIKSFIKQNILKPYVRIKNNIRKIRQ